MLTLSLLLHLRSILALFQVSTCNVHHIQWKENYITLNHIIVFTANINLGTSEQTFQKAGPTWCLKIENNRVLHKWFMDTIFVIFVFCRCINDQIIIEFGHSNKISKTARKFNKQSKTTPKSNHFNTKSKTAPISSVDNHSNTALEDT